MRHPQGDSNSLLEISVTRANGQPRLAQEYSSHLLIVWDRPGLLRICPRRQGESDGGVVDVLARLDAIVRKLFLMLQSLPMTTGLTRTLCIVVFVVMFAALIYAAWIGVENYSRIHV